MAEDFLHEDEEDWANPVENVACTAVTPKKAIHSKGLSNDQQRVNVGQLNQDNHSRTIVHIDLDCYYAQVEMVRNPSLRSKPLGIQQKYLLVTCNYVARSHGVTKLMRITEALKRCPDLVIVSGEDLTHYREMSYKITGILHQFSPLVERLGFDENFVDVTGLVEKRLMQGGIEEAEVIGHQYGEQSSESDSAFTRPHDCTCGCHHRLLIGSHIAQEMRQALNIQLGLTSCAGVAHNKLLAKLVGTTHKPNDQTTLWPSMTSHLMGRLTKATQVPGIGYSSGKKLALLGITTLTELIEAPFSLLKDEFGYQTASIMLKLCQGIDESPVVQSGPPQSISDEDSFRKCSTLQEAQLKISTLLKSLSQRLLKDGRQPHTLRLAVRKYSKTHKWSRESRQCPVPDGMLHSLQSDEATVLDKLLDLCSSLFYKMVDVSQPFHLTLISVGFAKFQTPTTKTSVSDISKFFTPRSEKRGLVNESIIKDGCTNITGDGDSNRLETTQECQTPTIKTSMSNISKFFTSRSVKRDPSIIKDGCTSSAGAGDSNRLETTQECQDMFKVHAKLLSNDVSQDELGSPNGSATVTACTYMKSNNEAKLTHPSSRSTMSCVSNTTAVKKNTNGNQTYHKNESDIKSMNEKSSPSFSSKAENKCMDASKSVSPKKGTSFFALKSYNIQPELTDSKTSVLEHFKNKMDSQKEEEVVRVSSLFLENGLCQQSTPSLRISNDNNSHGHFEITQEDDEEFVDKGEVDNATHHAVPPHIDPSVFSELPANIQEEILNDWQKSNTSPSKSSTDCETVASSSEMRLMEFPNIDRSVFEELPPDIQKDVLEQQKQKKRTLASISPTSQKTMSGKRPRNSKTPSEKGGTNGMKNKCIKDFFCPK
ncbi:DNA polymerase iota-like [Asterias rubens]|uniref:DNA polymerase iota-like n=1 Tax=Asterias rubens TaxID=7604 RepID=UPI001455C4A8|nr:DNA polymerase iota-like [Asterias rubens]